MPISLPDSRSLSDSVLNALRLRAIRGCEMGFRQEDLAELLGVASETISRWWSAYCARGPDGLPGDRTGRPTGSGRTLSAEQEDQLQALIDRNAPEDLGIAAPLWNRKAVQQLIRQETQIGMPIDPSIQHADAVSPGMKRSRKAQIWWTRKTVVL